MISVFLYLLCTALIVLMYHKTRFQKLTTACGGAVLAAISIGFYQNYLNADVDFYSYQWLSSRYYPVSIDFSSSLEAYLLMLPLFAVAVLNVFYMLWDTMEKQKTYLLTLMCLNIAFFMMLICGQNTIQIIVSACFVDVIGFCVINNIATKRQYIFYNLLTDLALFIAFAMLWGECRSTQLTQIREYTLTHNPFALWLILFSIYIKIGLFPFQGYLLQCSVLSESRRNIMGFLSTPIVGLLIFYKLKDFQIETGPTEILKYAIWATIIWGGCCSMAIRRMSDKNLYLNMLFYGMGCALLMNTEECSEVLGSLLVLHFCLNNSLTETRRYFVWAVAVALLEVGAVILVTYALPVQKIQLLYLLTVIMAVGSMISVLKDNEREENHLLKLLLATGCVAIIVYNHISQVPMGFYYWMGGCLLILLTKPFRYLEKMKFLENCQNVDVFSKLLHKIFIEPIYFLGRILLLTIDFLIIERVFLNSLTKMGKITADIFDYFHTKVNRSYVYFILLGFIILIYSSLGQ